MDFAILCIFRYIECMVKRYSIAASRSNLPTIVDPAEAGQEIELTRRGKAVAVVVSLREFARRRGERAPFADAYKRFLKTHALSEVGLDEAALTVARDVAVGRSVPL